MRCRPEAFLAQFGLSTGPHDVSDVKASDFVNVTVDVGNYEPSQVGIQNVDSLRV